ncbi:MAG: glycoside hydrolase family 3 C-terminal domain-containing protein [Melioribacteraceae bacterium]
MSKFLKLGFFLLLTFFFSNQIYSQTVTERIESLLSQMTLDEKILQLHAEGGFNTANNDRLNIPGFIMADGPHGVRDGLATSFPVGISMSATFDPDLIERVGIAMGKEFRGKGKHQALGPCLDLTRDPRNGRTPESGGEDPYLIGKINAALVQGMQSTGTIATVKHYNATHKQNGRMSNNYTIGDPMLMVAYGFSFRSALQDGGALSIMSAYNKLNDQYASENKNLLTTILRNNWGFPFYVVSDWGAIHNSELAIKAGCNICMGSDNYKNDLLNLVNSGAVSVSIIDEAVRNVLRTKILAGMLDYYPAGDPADINSFAHQALALEAGKKSLVLLKNQDNLLPLDKNKINKIAVVGPFANSLPLDGAGSAYVSPFYTVTPRQGIESYLGSSKVSYAKGVEVASGNASDIGTALNISKTSDLVIYFGGLDSSQEGEGFDRSNGSIMLPGKQNDFIKQLKLVNQNVIVVLISGGVCSVTPFVDDAKSILYAFYPGQEGGNAIAQVLFGDYNPAGRLPVTMPVNDSQITDDITDFDFNNDYACGYRYYDKQEMTPQYAFGFGLSYTQFQYSNLAISPDGGTSGDVYEVSFDLKNIGSRAGEEVSQLYLSYKGADDLVPPVKELKGFKRVYLDAGETKTIKLMVTANELYRYNNNSDAKIYQVPSGYFTFRVGGSSDNLPLEKTIHIAWRSIRSDLQIANIWTMPRYPLKGQQVHFVASVINRGSGSSPKGQFLQVNFLVNGVKISEALQFAGSIPAGGMQLIEGNVGDGAGPNYWTAGEPGEYTIEAIVDLPNTITEDVEGNNSKSVKLEVYPEPAVNLALGKSVKATSSESNLYPANNVTDGNYSTRWSSLFTDPQSITLDLGSVMEFNQIKLFWEAAYGKDYIIQVSDNETNWKTIATKTDGNGSIEKYDIETSGRYIKITGTARGTEYGYSLYEIEVYKAAKPVSVEDEKESLLPVNFKLSNNYPNPFNPSTTIEYQLPKEGIVKIEIYNSLGQLVKVLSDLYQNAGKYSISWNGKDTNGSSVSSGIYFYRMSTEGFTLVKKMMLLK